MRDPRHPHRDDGRRRRGWWPPDKGRLAVVLYAVLCVYFLLSILRAAGLI